MGNRPAKRRRCGIFVIDVNRVEVTGQLGEQLNILLRDRPGRRLPCIANGDVLEVTMLLTIHNRPIASASTLSGYETGHFRPPLAGRTRDR